MQDYLVSSIPSKVFVSDPVVVAIPIGWMRKIMKYHDAFDIFMDNMYSEDRFGDNYVRHSYTQSQNGKNASTHDLLGWIKATKEMIEDVDEGPEAWEYMRKNIPPDIMMGFDMEIGGSYMGPAFRKLLADEEFKNVDRLIIPLHDIIDSKGNPFPNNDIISMLSSSHIDTEGTLQITGNGGNGSPIKMGVISNNSINELLTNTGLIPKGLYQLKNLSDTNLSSCPSSINYQILKI